MNEIDKETLMELYKIILSNYLYESYSLMIGLPAEWDDDPVLDKKMKDIRMILMKTSRRLGFKRI